MEGRGKKGGGAFSTMASLVVVMYGMQFSFLNGQSQVLGVRELEEVANRDNGGLAGEEGLGNL